MIDHVKTNVQPRLVGFLCETGAYVFYDISNPARRKLPAGFVGLAVASISQVHTRQVLKAFLAGAEGVLIAGCEVCRRQNSDPTPIPFSELVRELAAFGIDSGRINLEWISAAEEEKFLRTVDVMMERLRRLPPLRLPAGLGENVVHCG